jgi:hypothetical protein
MLNQPLYGLCLFETQDFDLKDEFRVGHDSPVIERSEKQRGRETEIKMSV